MKKQIVLLNLALLLNGLPVSQAHDAQHHHHNETSALDTNRPEPLSGESLYQVTSTWSNQNNRKVKLDSLRGHPVLVAMIYTSCTGACPMTVADLKKIEGKLSATAREQVRVALFSFDSERDTPAKLAEYAKSRNIDLSRWSLFNAKPATVRELAALLGIQYKKTPGGDYDHSNVITVLDRDGVIRHQQTGLGKDPKETVAALEKLAH